MTYIADREQQEAHAAKRTAWLDGLAVGDIIAVRCVHQFGDDTVYKGQVASFTKTQIRVTCMSVGKEPRIYRRKDGICASDHHVSIEPLTAEIKQQWRENAMHNKIIAFINDVAYSRVKLRDLPMRKRLALLAAIEMPDLPEEPEQQALPGVADASK